LGLEADEIFVVYCYLDCVGREEVAGDAEMQGLVEGFGLAVLWGQDCGEG
jgi:hypothetical protein